LADDRRRRPWWRTDAGADWALLLALLMGGAAVVALVVGSITIAVQTRGSAATPRNVAPTVVRVGEPPTRSTEPAPGLDDLPSRKDGPPPREAQEWILSPWDPITLVPAPDGTTSAGDVVAVQTHHHEVGESGLTDARLVRFTLEPDGWKRRWTVGLPQAGETIATVASDQLIVHASDTGLLVVDVGEGRELARWPVRARCGDCVAVVGDTVVVLGDDGQVSGYRIGTPDPVWQAAQTGLPRSVRAIGGLIVANVGMPPRATGLTATGVIDPATGHLLNQLPDPCLPASGMDFPRTVLAAAPIGSSTSVVALVGAASSPRSAPCLVRYDLATGAVDWSRPLPSSEPAPAPRLDLLASPGHVTMVADFGRDSAHRGWATDIDPLSGRTTALEVPDAADPAVLVGAGPTVVAVVREKSPSGGWRLVGWDRAGGTVRLDVPLSAPVMPGLDAVADQRGAPMAGEAYDAPIAVVALEGTTWVIEVADGEVAARRVDLEAGRLGRRVGPRPFPETIDGDGRRTLLLGSRDSFAILEVGGELVAIETTDQGLRILVAH
jgi:hypothetical protein